MDSFEARLANRLALTEQPGDEAFVQSVTRSIAANEERRRVGLAVATLIVACLATALCYGIARAWSAVGAISGPAPEALLVAMPLLFVLIIVFASVLLLAFSAMEPA